jgi:hypothetical protein
MITITSEKINCLCHKCGKYHLIETKELKRDFYTVQRSMGDEVEYSWTYFGRCPNCNKKLNFNILAYEYPPSQFNWKDFTKSNCCFKNEEVKFSGCEGCDENFD